MRHYTTVYSIDIRDRDHKLKTKGEAINVLRELLRENKLFGETELHVLQA